MNRYRKEHVFAGRLVMLGFGCIGQGTLPLLLRHIALRPEQILVIDPDKAALRLAQRYGTRTLATRITPFNVRDVLLPQLAAGDFLLNLSVDVSSTALMRLCRERGALYLDTCIEPWAGGYIDTSIAPAGRTNYALREEVLAQRRQRGPTAVITHGANPGLVSHFVKQALLDIARDTGVAVRTPASREEWAQLAMRLAIRTIHIAERDTQAGARRKAPGEFVNTWSVEAFVDEGCQPAELGWGTHERHFPPDGARHEHGPGASIYLQRPGAGTRVRTWTPLAGPIHGFLVTHSEAISIADYLTLGDPARPAYRPTVHYAYHPCDDAVLSLHELAGRNWRVQPDQRVMKDEIESGRDELGVLLMGHARGAYWYGSQLAIEQARALAPHNSATSLQVTATVMAGVVWAMKHPDRDVLEPDELPFDAILPLARPYLGDVVGVYSDWTPLEGRSWLFPEDVDVSDPWQFKNFRVD
ncbi:MAG TPA: saccharopine dehydrogenase C-terminal domain-containing protein [Albitalea sp.]